MDWVHAVVCVPCWTGSVDAEIAQVLPLPDLSEPQFS